MNKRHVIIETLSQFSKKMSDFVRLDKTRSTGRKIASSLWSLFFGIVLAIVYIVLKKGVYENILINPLLIFQVVAKSLNSANREFIVNFFLVFGFSSLACALSFKAGLFNIGIPGQMMITGAVSFALFIQLGYTKYESVPIWLLILALGLSIVAAFFLGFISGFLKAKLNVHEVITTIMINWIVVGASMILFQQKSASIVWKDFSDLQITYYFSDTNTGVNPGAINIDQSIKNAFVIFGVVLLFVLVFAIAFVFNFTTIGYKIRMQGISKTNGKYMGVNDQMLTILILGFSGAISGIAGFYNYVIAPSTAFGAITEPLVIGFESIAISLLALNAPVGILFSTLFYTTIYTARINLQFAPLNIKPEDVQVITSMILFLAATSIMFVNFKPINFLKRRFILYKDARYKAHNYLKSLELQRLRMQIKHQLQVHKLKYNVTESNLELLNLKYNNLELSFQQALLKNNILTQRATLQLIYAEKMQSLKNDLALAKSANNIEQKTQISAKIQELKKQHIAKTNSLGSFAHSYKTLKIDPVSLVAESTSRKDQVKILKAELKKVADEYLSQAMNYKNSDEQTIHFFEQINDKKHSLVNKMNELGANAKFKIQQQRTASIKNIKAKYEQIFISLVAEHTKLKTQLKQAKGAQ